MPLLFLVVQLPRKLGLFASTQLMPSPYDSPSLLAATVTLVEAVAVLTKAAIRNAPQQVQSAMLQQMIE